MAVYFLFLSFVPSWSLDFKNEKDYIGENCKSEIVSTNSELKKIRVDYKKDRKSGYDIFVAPTDFQSLLNQSGGCQLKEQQIESITGTTVKINFVCENSGEASCVYDLNLKKIIFSSGMKKGPFFDLLHNQSFLNKIEGVVKSEYSGCPLNVQKIKKLDSRFSQIIYKCGGLASAQDKTSLYIYDHQFKRMVFAYVNSKVAYKFSPKDSDQIHTGPIKGTMDRFWCMAEDEDVNLFMKNYKNDLIPEEFNAQISREITRSRVKAAHLGELHTGSKSKNTR